MDSKYIVYAIVALVLLQAYVGSTIDSERRWKREHLPRLRKNKHENKVLQAAFNEHGEEYFDFIPLEYVDCIDSLPEREKEWIRDLKNIGVALNHLISGNFGNRGRKLSEATRTKQSLAKRGDNKHPDNRKDYQFIAPDGTIRRVHGLKQLCQVHNLSMSGMSRVHQGKQKSCKGWTKAGVA